MNNFINGYISRNSIIHKMNPTLKMLMFISFMILIFIPIGFVAQMIVWLIVSFSQLKPSLNNCAYLIRF